MLNRVTSFAAKLAGSPPPYPPPSWGRDSDRAIHVPPPRWGRLGGGVGGAVTMVALFSATVFLASCNKSDEPASSGGPAVIRRLTQEQYQTVIADIFGADIKIGGRFEPDIRKSGLLAVGAGEVSVTPSGFEQYDSMARSAAAQIVDEHHRDMLVGCKPASAKAPDDACTRPFYAKVGRILYRRPLTPAELDTQ